MKLIIFGSRSFVDDYFDKNTGDTILTGNYQLLSTIVESCKCYKDGLITEEICGMAKGADMLGRKWAMSKGIPVREMPAQWNDFGLAAGPIRNDAMAKIGDKAIGFWTGVKSHSGTFNMIKLCVLKHKIPTIVYRMDTQKIQIITVDTFQNL